MHHYEFPHPAVATDICIFTVADGELRILLIQRAQSPFEGCWALPGGFLGPSEDLDACARRELLEEAGIETPALHQFGVFSCPDRDIRVRMIGPKKAIKSEYRVISVGYVALVSEAHTPPLRAGSDAKAAQWFSMGHLPALAFDHGDIIRGARRALIKLIEETPAAFALLPETFTLTQLQAVYEAVEGRQIDKRNFRNEIDRKNWVVETDQFERGRHRPARLFVRKTTPPADVTS